MTIGIGFVCEDGIAFCADTQITWPGSHKHYECKIYPHGNNDWTMVNTFAGDPDLARSFNGKFDDAMAKVSGPFTASKIQDVIETVLSFLDVLDANPTDLLMLCGISIPTQETRLVRTSGKVVSQINDHSYVGVGDSSLLRHLAQLLLPFLQKPYQARVANRLGTYFVLKAKAHIDGCGGDSDIAVLRPNGHIEWHSSNYYAMEQRMLRLEHYVRRTSACFFDKRVSEEEFDKQVAELVRVLKEERNSYF